MKTVEQLLAICRQAGMNHMTSFEEAFPPKKVERLLLDYQAMKEALERIAKSKPCELFHEEEEAIMHTGRRLAEYECDARAALASLRFDTP